jgi:hypothetical protein
MAFGVQLAWGEDGLTFANEEVRIQSLNWQSKMLDLFR